MNKMKEICLIDDDKIYIMVAKRIFENSNLCHEFQIFNNGEDAYLFLKNRLEKNEKFPDLILLDINMPVMDGWDFLDAIEKLTNLPPINLFLVSSSIDPRDLEKSKTYKLVKDFILKPITKEAIELLTM
jgi:CheY-like chemotaxis protein